MSLHTLQGTPDRNPWLAAALQADRTAAELERAAMILGSEHHDDGMSAMGATIGASRRAAGYRLPRWADQPDRPGTSDPAASMGYLQVMARVVTMAAPYMDRWARLHRLPGACAEVWRSVNALGVAMDAVDGPDVLEADR